MVQRMSNNSVGVDQCEVHCTACGAQMGFFPRGVSRGVPCSRCKRKMSFEVLEKEVFVKCNRDKN